MAVEMCPRRSSGNDSFTIILEGDPVEASSINISQSSLLLATSRLPLLQQLTAELLLLPSRRIDDDLTTSRPDDLTI